MTEEEKYFRQQWMTDDQWKAADTKDAEYDDWSFNVGDASDVEEV